MGQRLATMSPRPANYLRSGQQHPQRQRAEGSQRYTWEVSEPAQSVQRMRDGTNEYLQSARCPYHKHHLHLSPTSSQDYILTLTCRCHCREPRVQRRPRRAEHQIPGRSHVSKASTHSRQAQVTAPCELLMAVHHRGTARSLPTQEFPRPSLVMSTARPASRK